MKTPTLIAALAIAGFAGAASAQEATYELPQPIVSQTTRAAVTAAAIEARARGPLVVTDFHRQQSAPFVSTVSRAEVRAQAIAAYDTVRASEGEA